MDLKVSYSEHQPSRLERKYDLDAGLDIPALRGFDIAPGETVMAETGVRVQLPEGTAGLIVGRSSINRRGVMVQGLIDEGYSGEISVTMTNADRFDSYHVCAGDRIAQLLVVPIARPEVIEVDRINGGPRGGKGFGSTGR